MIVLTRVTKSKCKMEKRNRRVRDACMMSYRWLKAGTVFGIIVSVAFFTACGGSGGGGSGGGGGPVAISVNVSYPSESFKASEEVSAGTVTIRDLAENTYDAAYQAGSLAVVNGLDTCAFMANVPVGETLFVVAMRNVPAVEGGPIHTERMELIIPAVKAGDQTLDIGSTQIAAILKKQAEHAGMSLSQLTQDAITAAVWVANNTLEMDLSAYDFDDFNSELAMDDAELKEYLIDYAIMHAVANLVEEDAGAWLDYDESYADITSALITGEIDANTRTAIEADLAANANTIVATVDAITNTMVEGRLAFNVGGLPVSTYEERVANFKAAYGKSDEWETWMITHKWRYSATFLTSQAKPATLAISFEYEQAPFVRWANEEDHMDALEAYAEAGYPGYNFDFLFQGDRSTSYAYILADPTKPWSYSIGREIGLIAEGIFIHEFGHRMKLQHHYHSDPSEKIYLPPGEDKCIMARNSYMWCSGCRTALGIPLDIDNAAAVVETIVPTY
jgi:hypothetical protein